MRFLHIAIAAGILCASVGTASAQAWQFDADDGTGTDLTTTFALRDGSTSPVYYFVAATGTTDSNSFVVAKGSTATVTLNANTGGTGANAITANLMRRISYRTAAGVNNGIVVAGTSLTGAGNTSMLWEVPWGEYWIDIITATAAGDSVFVVELGIPAK